MAASPSPTAVKATTALAGITSLLVLIQAVTGGLTAREVRHGVVNAHSGVAYLVAVLAVVLVVMAAVMWRGAAGGQVVLGETVALLVCVIIQIGIGMQIKEIGQKGHPGLLAIHVPLALIIFGITLHLQTFVANLRRGGR